LHTVTALQAAPLVSAEKFTPATHGAHWRLKDADPALDIPNPVAHVRHAVHDASPALAVNVPWVQLAHARSLVAVAAAVVYVPAMQGLLTPTHGAASSTLENDTPTWHAAQVRSAVADPAASKPVPTEHMSHAVHAWFPVDDLNIP
jgi:hypothetical protein